MLLLLQPQYSVQVVGSSSPRDDSKILHPPIAMRLELLVPPWSMRRFDILPRAEHLSRRYAPFPRNVPRSSPTESCPKLCNRLQVLLPVFHPFLMQRLNLTPQDHHL